MLCFLVIDEKQISPRMGDDLSSSKGIMIIRVHREKVKEGE
jgi:hypothetical protein